MVPVHGPCWGTRSGNGRPVSYLTAVLGSIWNWRLQASEDLSTLVPEGCYYSMLQLLGANLIAAESRHFLSAPILHETKIADGGTRCRDGWLCLGIGQGIQRPSK